MHYTVGSEALSRLNTRLVKAECAVQAMAVSQRQQLDQRSGLALPPRIVGDGLRTTDDAKAAQQADAPQRSLRHGRSPIQWECNSLCYKLSITERFACQERSETLSGLWVFGDLRRLNAVRISVYFSVAAYS